MRTLDDINAKISDRQATVWTVEQVKAQVAERGAAAIAQIVDVITCGTFEPMESSGAIINLGHTDPPIKIRQCWLDGVLAYSGFGAVDLYLGATQMAEGSRSGDALDSDEGKERGGGHVIADLVADKSVQLRAIGQMTDCYPRASLETTITRSSINQFYLFNPRNLYQNFIVGVNGGDRPLFTYLGPLQPRLGNAVYSNPGAISPLWNDPDLDLIGIGSRIWLGGAEGYVTWEGTQHFPVQRRLPNRTPIGPAATVALVGDAKQMSPRWVRGCYLRGYGPSLMLGVGVALPVLNEQVVTRCAVQDEDIVAPVVDFSIPRRVRPTFGLVSYRQLKSGKIMIDGRVVRSAPLASLAYSQQISEALKAQIELGEFYLSQPVAPLPKDRAFMAQESWGGKTTGS